MKIGDYVWCKYQATTNSVGVFSDFAIKTDEEVENNIIPPASTNVPNAYFKFICVDDEYNKKKTLIADRNIQHSISWDALNSAGIASGSGLPINLIDNSIYDTSIRLLTGGVNNTDKDNEWDKCIVSSTLNGSIVAGDNNVWNWSGKWSWLSTSHIANSSTKVFRGNTGANTHSFNSTNSSGVSLSFRPVLIIEDTLKTHSFIKSNNQYKTFKNNQWNNISSTPPSESVFVSDGMQNLSILDRKETNFTQDMTSNGVLGEGKFFKSTIDLKKLFEIKNIEVN